MTNRKSEDTGYTPGLRESVEALADEWGTAIEPDGSTSFAPVLAMAAELRAVLAAHPPADTEGQDALVERDLARELLRHQRRMYSYACGCGNWRAHAGTSERIINTQHAAHIAAAITAAGWRTP